MEIYYLNITKNEAGINIVLTKSKCRHFSNSINRTVDPLLELNNINFVYTTTVKYWVWVPHLKNLKLEYAVHV